MKFLRVIFALTLFISYLFGASQPAPCILARSALVVTVSRAMYCEGDSINFILNPVAPSTISGVLNWKFTGVVTNKIMSGTQNKIYDLEDIQLTGVVTVTGTLINPTMCTLTRTFNVNVSSPGGLTALAGTDAFYGGSAVPLGTSTCATGGSGTYTYLWSPSTGLSSSSSCGPNASPSSTTTYTLKVTDGNNCRAYDEVTVVNMGGVISYIVPKKTEDGGFYKPQNGRVYFKFEEEYRAGTITYEIRDYAPASANVQPTSMGCSLSASSAKVLGDNRYYIDVSACSLITSKFYLVELTNDKREKFYFKILN